ncbi:MAG TPA: sugar ABC transporter ATP-binding protein [Atribacteraceae bacterium]|nr:sugar ABC transporter ATP-binding protein [Atribacteraceae bacterium]
MLFLMKGINKKYPGVQALKNVDFSLDSGEIHALIGENGAGKSTLMKILSGAENCDSGEIILKGRRLEHLDPLTARKAGIAIIYQERNLVPPMNAMENIFLGKEIERYRGLIDAPSMYAETDKLFRSLHVNIDYEVPVGQLSVAQQQMVEIAKALSENAEVLVMDEPTAALTEKDVENLFAIMRRLREQGVGIVYISHQLGEVLSICDRYTVLRDGEVVGSGKISKVDEAELISKMIGRKLSADEYTGKERTFGEEVLRVEGLTRGKDLKDVSFSVRAGEILGIAGLVGSGRTEMVRAIFGADPLEKGHIFLNGKPVTINSPYQAVRLGIGFCTEDRKTQGLVLKLPIRDNVGVASLAQYSHLGLIDDHNLTEHVSDLTGQLNLQPPDIWRIAANLSGGNQQKVVLAKWLATNSRILIFDEPTRGIDVGAKVEIHNLIRELAAMGKAIIMISSELPEVLRMSDRILVMCRGKIQGEISRDKANAEEIWKLSQGLQAACEADT